ncbi:hypothetical protein V1478_008539, partial [Vespula squamosa]
KELEKSPRDGKGEKRMQPLRVQLQCVRCRRNANTLHLRIYEGRFGHWQFSQTLLRSMVNFEENALQLPSYLPATCYHKLLHTELVVTIRLQFECRTFRIVQFHVTPGHRVHVLATFWFVKWQENLWENEAVGTTKQEQDWTHPKLWLHSCVT